jgi:cell division protein FtsB
VNIMSKNTQDIAGLRFQKYDTGEVHIHDDVKNLKFIAKIDDFKKEVEDFIKQDSDGATIIEGVSKERLLLIKEGKNVITVVLDSLYSTTIFPESKSTKEFIAFVDSL